MTTPTLSSLNLRYTAAVLVARIVASLLGVYVFIWGIMALGITGLVAMGVDYEEAYLLFKLSAFLVFLALFLWCYATQGVLKLWLIFVGGGTLMIALAWLIQNQLMRGV
ncbi:MAG: iron uptake protein [Marinagarivorans sp.]|nr:iron uptake protein [Marinagarivorans sp.]